MTRANSYKAKLMTDREVMNLAREVGLPKAMYDTEGWRSMLALFAHRVRSDCSSGPESDGGITQALVEMARANAIEECARALEPANHPLLMAAVKTIRALSSSATSHQQ